VLLIVKIVSYGINTDVKQSKPVLI